MKRAAAALLAVVVLSGCGDDKPERDPARWDDAVHNARYRCALMGYAQYTDEFESCVADQAELIYAEENNK